VNKDKVAKGCQGRGGWEPNARVFKEVGVLILQQVAVGRRPHSPLSSRPGMLMPRNGHASPITSALVPSATPTAPADRPARAVKPTTHSSCVVLLISSVVFTAPPAVVLRFWSPSPPCSR